MPSRTEQHVDRSLSEWTVWCAENPQTAASLILALLEEHRREQEQKEIDPHRPW
jgi:hypothetical protein